MSSLQIALPIAGLVVDDSACDADDLAFCGGVQVTVSAGEGWDALVERAIAGGWTGVEALSGIPGTVADVVRENSAAYGQAIADSVASVRTWDRAVDAQSTFPAVECEFVKRGSRLREQLADGGLRYQLLDVAFLFKQGDFSAPIVDEVLAEALSVAVGARVPLSDVRAAVLVARAVHETPSDPGPDPAEELTGTSRRRGGSPPRIRSSPRFPGIPAFCGPLPRRDHGEAPIGLSERASPGSLRTSSRSFGGGVQDGAGLM